MKTIKIILVLLCIIVGVNVNAKKQTVSYSYKPLSLEGCNVRLGVTKRDTCYYIIVTVRSENMRIFKEPTMMLKTFDNDVLKFNGTNLSDDSVTGGVVMGNFIVPATEIISTAQFQATPEEFELIRKGISKVRLTTIPVDHEIEFESDRIGAKLYKFFKTQQEKGDEF